MTAHQDADMPASRPAGGRLIRPAVPPPAAAAAAAEAADVAQGQAAAVLGALARMQLRLDVLAREQSDMYARLLARFDQLESTLLARDLPTAEATVEPAATLPAEVTEPVDGTVPARSWRDRGR